jgi:hypothetical protein
MQEEIATGCLMLFKVRIDSVVYRVATWWSLKIECIGISRMRIYEVELIRVWFDADIEV